MTTPDWLSLGGLVIGSGGLGGFITHRVLGLGNGNGWKAQMLHQLRDISRHTESTSKDVAILRDRSDRDLLR